MGNYYTIIPAVKLPRAAPDEYTYRGPDGLTLKPDTLVSIPFRKRFAKGLITGITRRPPFTVKPITKVIGNLPPRFSEFLFAFSRLTFEHPGTLLRLCLLHTREEGEMVGRDEEDVGKRSRTPLTVKQYQTEEERASWLVSRARQAAALHRSLLVIIPNAFEAKRIFEWMNHQGVPCVLFTGSKTIRTRISRTTPCPCIVATRVGCLLPRAFRETICDDEPNELYVHNEPSPAYDARAVMELRTSFLNESLTYSGYSLSLATRSLPRVRLPNALSCRAPSVKALQWVSLSQSLRSSQTPFAEQTMERLRETPWDVIVVTQRGEYARSVVCASCGRELACPFCERPFQSRNDYQLLCSRCGVSSSVPPFCSLCSGPTFRYLGFGARRAAEILRQKLSLSHPKVSVTSTTFQRFEQTLAEQPPKRPYVVVIPCVDALVLPHFDGQEMMYHRLVKLIAQSRPHPIIVQYFSERLRRDAHQLSAFFEQERSLRASLQLPPRKTLLLIRYYSPRARKKDQLTFEQAQETIASLMGVDAGDMQGIAQKKRGIPYFLFSVRLDSTAAERIEWKKIPLGFHCRRYR